MQQKEYKKNVLISAFNCSPYAGSEQYLGWSSAVAQQIMDTEHMC